MKAIKSVVLISFICLFACQSATVEANPVITKKYSDKEISDKVAAYKLAHDTDVAPTAVQSQKLTKDFPNAKSIDWETASGIYKVDFEIGRTDYKAYYDDQSELLMYSLEIRESALPAIVKNAVIGKYPDYKFDDIKKVCRGSETFYKMELKRNKVEANITVKSDGTFSLSNE